jgi:hypothetical protein
VDENPLFCPRLSWYYAYEQGFLPHLCGFVSSLNLSEFVAAWERAQEQKTSSKGMGEHACKTTREE